MKILFLFSRAVAPKSRFVTDCYKHNALSNTIVISLQRLIYRRWPKDFTHFALAAGALLLAPKAAAQDPVLPPTNLGLANIFDGFAGKPGWIYQGYVQVFSSRQAKDGYGHSVAPGLKINSMVSVQQLIYLTPVKVLGGNLAFTVLVPVVQITASHPQGQAPSVNPGVLGDIIQGTAIQWSDRKLFGKPFSHRAEFDIVLPVGAYDSNYAINPSSHLFTYSAYHAFTVMLSNKISMSVRNQVNYNGHIINQKAKPGAFYNGNYSIDYAIMPSLRIEAVGYFLKQFEDDSYDGQDNYYASQYGIANTKEQVFAYGPGLAYFGPHGVLIEAKAFFETAVENRIAGSRATLRVVIPLTK